LLDRVESAHQTVGEFELLLVLRLVLQLVELYSFGVELLRCAGEEAYEIRYPGAVRDSEIIVELPRHYAGDGFRNVGGNRVEKATDFLPRSAAGPIGAKQVHYVPELDRCGVEFVTEEGREDNRVDVPASDPLVGYGDPRHAHDSADHVGRIIDTGEISRPPLRVGGDERRRISATPSASRSLDVVRGTRRHVPQNDWLEIADVHTEFECGGA